MIFGEECNGKSLKLAKSSTKGLRTTKYQGNFIGHQDCKEMRRTKRINLEKILCKNP
jgi:hypothetical protein